MIENKLSNGVVMHSPAFGVFQIPDHDECVRVVKDALEVGYRHIDTAQGYQNEAAVGEAINTSGINRDEIFVTTKIWIDNVNEVDAYNSVLNSLSVMKLDYIDLVLIHQPFNDAYGAYRAMTKLYNEGKIKAMGVSNFLPDRVVDFATYNKIVPMVNQIEINPFHQQEEAVEVNDKYCLHVCAWAPFAEGKNDIFNNEVLKAIGIKYDKSPAQVILRWLIQRGITPISKTVNKARMIENFNILDFELSDEDMNEIKTLNTDTSMFFDHSDYNIVEYMVGLSR